MSFWWGKAKANSTDTFAGGVASVSDVYASAYNQFLTGANTNSASLSLEKAYDERIAEVFSATGVKLDNPMRALKSFPSQEALRDYGDPSRFMAKVDEAARRIPDQNVAGRLTRSIEGDAQRIARQADARAANVFASRPGVVSTLTGFAAGAAAMLRDPIQLPLMMVGGGIGAGRTVAGRVLSTAAREAVINGATQAAAEPAVQAWRARAGLDAGLDVALKDIGFAALLGGVLGGGGQALGEGIARLTNKGMDAAASVAQADPRVAEPVRKAMAGDIKAAQATLPEIRDALPADARGALDHAEVLDHAEQLRPASIDPETHDRAIAAAHRIEAYEPARMPVNDRLVERITDQLMAPMEATQGAPRPKSLVEFLKAEGGVLDQAGELKAIGAEALAKKSGKRGQPDKRVALDHARERAEQAGYIGRAGETQTTTVADLLDAIDRDLRGDKVYSRNDDAAPPPGFEAERQRVRDRVAELTELVGPGTDEKLLRRAAELSLRDDIDVADAFERVVMESAPNAGRNVAAEDIPPGWSDAELEAAAAERGAEPDGHMATPFDDPASIDPEFEISARDLADYGDVEIIGDDGPMTLSAMMDDIKQDTGMAALVRACRTGD